VSAQIIDGKAIAADLRASVAIQARNFAQTTGIIPGLAVILVGDDAASAVYVRNKMMKTAAAGMRSFEHKLPQNTPESNLLDLIAKLNADAKVHGILVQLPLPPQIETGKVIAAIDPTKDVDGFHPLNVGRLAIGMPALTPCTPHRRQTACAVAAR
jgi:methylenetetrahydrofolate dehydrogenase (NADP+)/methenyltetrahydrofolate cyclohydrolase